MHIMHRIIMCILRATVSYRYELLCIIQCNTHCIILLFQHLCKCRLFSFQLPSRSTRVERVSISELCVVALRIAVYFTTPCDPPSPDCFIPVTKIFTSPQCHPPRIWCIVNIMIYIFAVGKYGSRVWVGCIITSPRRRAWPNQRHYYY